MTTDYEKRIIKTNWYTYEVGRIIMKDEDLYYGVIDPRKHYDEDDIEDVAECLEHEIGYIIEEYFKSIDLTKVDWTDVARECIREA